MQATACLLLRRSPTTARHALASSLRTASGASASASATASAVFSTLTLRSRPVPPRICGYPAQGRGHIQWERVVQQHCRGFASAQPSSWWQSLRASASRAAASLEKGLPPSLKPVALPPPGAPPGTAARVLALHVDAFWQAHGPKVLGLAAAAATYGAWKATSAVARSAVGGGGDAALSARHALAAAGAAVALVAGLAATFRSRYALAPETVYRAALSRLYADPGVLELMGPPLVGSPARALVQTGGGLRLRPAGGGRSSFLGLPLPAPRSRRIHMVFPLAGTSRRGLAAVEAKKRNGRLVLRVLAVDVPVERAGVPVRSDSPSGSSAHASPWWEHRVFLEGDDAAYGRGGVFAALRGPFSQSLALRRAHDEEDDLDDAAAAAAVAAAARADAAAAVLAGGGDAPPSWWWLKRRAK